MEEKYEKTLYVQKWGLQRKTARSPIVSIALRYGSRSFEGKLNFIIHICHTGVL